MTEDMTDFLLIDGSDGEGGGQVVRSSLTLSIATGTPVRVANVRAGRKKPGLMRQHLTAVQAAATVGAAEVTGDAVGSTELTFRPGRAASGGSAIVPGEHRFAVGTAGSATLVLQTVLPVLLTADAPSRLTLEGGTHNPFAPPFEFLDRVYLPLVNRMGPAVEAHLQARGFYPAGGGRFTVDVTPTDRLAGVDLLHRGEPVGHRATAIVANLDRRIAEKELTVVADRLGWAEDRLRVEEARGPGPGNVLLLTVEHEHVTEVFAGFGEVRRSAKAVGNLAVEQARAYLAHDAPVGPFLADQLLLPAALAAAGGSPSSYRITRGTRHLRTHLDLVNRFLPIRASLDADGTVRVELA